MILLALSSLLWICPLQGTRSQAPVQTAQPWPETVYNVSLLLIGRSVDDADPADEQVGWGLEFDTYHPSVILGFEMGVSRTSDEASVSGGKFEATVKEIYMGARKTWGASGELHPYLGGGLSFVEAEADASGLGSEDDNSFGLYAHGGAYWTLGEHFNLGADVRALVGTDLGFGDANYVQAAILLGYSI